MGKQKQTKKKGVTTPSPTKLVATGDQVKKTTDTLKKIRQEKAAGKARTGARSSVKQLDTSSGDTPTPVRSKKRSSSVAKTPRVTPTPRRRKTTVVALPPDVDTTGGLGTNARANKAFTDLVAEPRAHVITGDNYMSELNKSVRENRPISYVVNIILPYKNAGDIPRVVAAITAGATGMDGRVAFVFGLNGKAAEAAELDRAWKAAETAIGTNALPIALVKDMFTTSKFPYGTMRNKVLQSTSTAEITKAMYGKGTHPYISIQDFDTAMRTVPSGAHVFNHFADKLAGKDPLNPDEDIPIRPMMMSGGYRVGGGTTMPSSGTHNMQVGELEEHINEDMLTRSKLAEIHPLLPYSPEPNLYVDGTLLLAGGKQLAFGDGGAEFGALSKILNTRYATELASLATTPVVETEPPPDETVMGEDSPTPTITTTVPVKLDEMAIDVPPTPQPAGPVPLDMYLDTETPDKSDVPLDTELASTLISLPPKVVPEGPPEPTEEFFDPMVEGNQDFLMDLDKTEQRSFVQGFAENVRHPVRGVPFLTDFIDGAIETDLTRIAASLEKGWKAKEEGYSKHKLAQSHVPPKPAADRIFALRDVASGTSLKGYGDAERDADPMGVRMFPPPPRLTRRPTMLPVVPETGGTNWDTVPAMEISRDGMRRTAPGTTQLWSPTDVELRPMVGATQFKGTKNPAVKKSTGKGELNKPYDRLSQSVSGELPAPFARIYAGIPPSQTALSLHGVALSSPTKDALRKLELLSAMLDGPVATGTVYDAVAQTLGKSPAALRKAVIDTAVAQLKTEDSTSFLVKQPLTTFIVQNPMSNGDFTVALAQNRTRVVPKPRLPDSTAPEFLPGDTERAQNAHELMMRLLANHLGRYVHVYLTVEKGVLEFEPFEFGPKAKPASLSITDTVTIDDDGQEKHLYTTRQ